MAPLSRQRRLLLALVSALLIPSGPARAATDGFDDTDYLKMMDERDRGAGWNISLGLTAGYTDVLQGYKDYNDLGNAGVDIYFRPPIPLFPQWYHRMLFRVSGDYFPLEVPDYIAYTEEDLITVSATALYRFLDFSGTPENHRFVPFIGAGPAVGWDRVSVDHPAVQSSGSYMALGYSASAGLMFPCFGNFRLIPEVRYQSMHEPDGYWTSHISYMVGLSYWLPSNISE